MQLYVRKNKLHALKIEHFSNCALHDLQQFTALMHSSNNLTKQTAQYSVFCFLKLYLTQF